MTPDLARRLGRPPLSAIRCARIARPATTESQYDAGVARTLRSSSDEHYVLDLCDEVLEEQGSRQHRFSWLLADPSPKTGLCVSLPVDSYWPNLGLVVEFHERQHSEAIAFFDKPDKLTVSGVHRCTQRAIYDDRRRRLIPDHGLVLLIITLDEFDHRRGKIGRQPERDIDTIARRLRDVTSGG